MLEIAKKEAMVTSRLHGNVAVSTRWLAGLVSFCLGSLPISFGSVGETLVSRKLDRSISASFRVVSRSASVWFWGERRG